MSGRNFTARARKSALVTLLAGLCLVAGAHAACAVTSALCIKSKGKGTIKVRDGGCKSSEIQIGTFDTVAPLLQLTGVPRDVSVRLYRNGASIPDTTETSASFGVATEKFDTANLHDEVVNPDRLTASETGKYYVYADVMWTNPGNGTIRYAAILSSATTEIGGIIAASEVPPVPGAAFTRHSLSTHINLTAGDYVTLVLFQDSGGALLADELRFGMVKVP